MINAKAWNVQIHELLQERAKRPRVGTESVLGVRVLWSENDEPQGGELCFIPRDEIDLDNNDEFPHLSDQRILEVINGEQLMIATDDDVDQFIVLRTCGDISLYDRSDSFDNVFDKGGNGRGYYMIVVDGLNIPLQDLAGWKKEETKAEPKAEPKAKPLSFL